MIEKRKHYSSIRPQTTCGKTTGPCKLPKLKSPPKYKDTMTSIQEEEQEEEDEEENNLVSLGYPVWNKDVEISAAQCIPFKW